MNTTTRMTMVVCFVFVFFLGTGICFSADGSTLEEKAREARKMEDLREEGQKEQRESVKEQWEAAKAKREAEKEAKKKAVGEAEIRKRLVEILPKDTTKSFTATELKISGNTLITTQELLDNMPLVYNASDKPLHEADSGSLYDLRVIHDLITEPGVARQVSSRTIQGLTQYILSVYQKRNYAGIYVYMPADATTDGTRLRNGILPIVVLEAKVTDVTVKTYDPDQNPTEKGYLRKSAVLDWSPVKEGAVANQKELDDFVNQLNLNPDRYVSAVVTQGREPKSLAVNYDIYEANPWHWFWQIDNSGTRERQWNPKLGLINTNLFGIDDTFTAVYQAPWDATIDDHYSLYGSYDFPLMGPRLRLNLYGGHSEFDISPESGIFDFLGRGTVYGAVLRYNFLQTHGWFFDVKGTLEHTRSKVTPSLFPSFLGTDIKFWLWGAGIDIHRQDDMSRTSISFDRYASLGGESKSSEFNLARTNSDSLFTIYTASASHSQYLDENKVQQLSGTFHWIGSNERLVPAKMTAFGGMYTVRGYDEYEYVADGGIITSLQYEFDLVEYENSKMAAEAGQGEQEEEPFLRKLAPLVFFDYGRGKIRHPVGTEKGHEEMFSVGTGLIVELGEHFSGTVYYGYPLTATVSTRRGKGRVSTGLLVRW